MSVELTVFWCSTSSDYQSNQRSAAQMDYIPASFTCPPTAHSDDNDAVNIVMRKQLNSVINKHVHHG